MNALYRGDAFRIVRGASGSRGKAADRPVIVFQCYLDDSGTSGLPVVTMAGFVATLGHWEVIEPTADAIMNGYGIEVFHAKEFHSTRPPFKGWSGIKKRTFVDEIFSEAHGRMYGVSVTANKADHAAAQKNHGILPSMSPYAVCFSSIMVHLTTHSELGPAMIKEGLSFLVESGNNNNAEVEQLFHKASKMPLFAGCLRSLTFIAKDSCRAIQVADLYAFYSRREMRNHDRFAGKLALPESPILKIIEKHVPVWQRGVRGRPISTGVNAGRLPDLNALRELMKRKPR